MRFRRKAPLGSLPANFLLGTVNWKRADRPTACWSSSAKLPLRARLAVVSRVAEAGIPGCGAHLWSPLPRKIREITAARALLLGIGQSIDCRAFVGSNE